MARTHGTTILVGFAGGTADALALLDEILFKAPTFSNKTIRITKQYVRERIESILEDADLSRFIR